MEAKYKFKRYWFHIKNLRLLPKRDIIIFENIAGKHVPLKPFPIKFIATEECIVNDTVEYMKISFTSLFITIVQNFITMNYHRFMLIIHWIGFLDTPPQFCLDWSWFRWDFWNVRKERKKKILSKRAEVTIKILNSDKFVKEVQKYLMQDEFKRREN